ncbi:MAG: D-alanyl-D-alanine carboxypeptidase [Erysipelotrichales bacterium]|nr:D-alanyl-D-alanine carboxypeptidase [Erysipelotrichales bacterium]
MRKLIIITLLLLIPVNVFAIETSAKSSVLVEVSSKNVLDEKEKDLELPMASMTKMMTLLLVMEKLDQKKISLTDMVAISAKAAGMGGSQVYLEEGTSYKLETLLKSVAIASANDSAVALAEYVAGSTDEFIRLMNEKVSSLGLKHTAFKNVHGLDEEGHYSSAYDMAMIALELLKHPAILNYTKIYEDYVEHPNGNKTWIVNTNKLINYYEGVDGLKTGFTDNSGYCITVTAKRGNMRLVSVVMGEADNKVRNQDIMTLLNHGFSNFKLETIIDPNTNLGFANIRYGAKDKVPVKLENDAVDLVNINESNNYSYEIIKDDVKAPLKKGSIVGHVNIYSNDKKIKEINLIIEEEVKRANIFTLYHRNLNKLLKGAL